MSTLQRAIEIAVEGHRGQMDKAGAAYILHPLRVMLSLPTEEAMIVGVLHDVVEDCDGWSLERLRREGFRTSTLEAIDAVTKRPEEHGDYFAFIDRASRNPIGRLVKMADLTDNLRIDRISSPSPGDIERMERYRKALEMLSS